MMFKYIDEDIVNMRKDDGNEAQFYWGDKVEIIDQSEAGMRVAVHGARGEVARGTISAKTRLRDDGLLRLSMVDVQQGDGLILATPGGRVKFIDGGDNQLFARHANARFPDTSEDDPLIVDLMLITHGDADHFDGLNELRASETDSRPGKRIFLAPRRVYHNGLVKRPGTAAGKRKRPDRGMFGPTVERDGTTYATGLVDDPAAVAPAERNAKFDAWVRTLDAWEDRVRRVTGSGIERRRLDHRSTDAFGFLEDEGVSVELLGPIVDDVDGAPALRFLRKPPDDADLTPSATNTELGRTVGHRPSHGRYECAGMPTILLFVPCASAVVADSSRSKFP